MHSSQTTPLLGRPGVDKIVRLYMADTDVFYTDILGETVTSKQTFYRILTEGEFGNATIHNEGQPLAFDDFRTPYTMDVYAKKRRIGWQATSEAEEEDMYNILARAANKLRLSLKMTMERVIANQYNNVTSTSAPYKTPDGLALGSASHLIEGGTASNLTTEAFGALALENRIQEMLATVSHRGDPNPITGPFILIVPPALAGVANRVVKASGLAQSANNDPNWAGGMISKVSVNPFLTDTNNYFLQSAASEKRPVCLLRRRPPVTKVDYDINTDKTLVAVTEMYVPFNKDWRGLIAANV